MCSLLLTPFLLASNILLALVDHNRVFVLRIFSRHRTRKSCKAPGQAINLGLRLHVVFFSFLVSRSWSPRQSTALKADPFSRLSPPRRSRVATFERASGGSIDCDYDMLVGADGVNSRVREALKEHVPDFTVRQEEVCKTLRSQPPKNIINLCALLMVAAFENPIFTVDFNVENTRASEMGSGCLYVHVIAC